MLLVAIALKHTLPKLSIEKHINEEPPREFQINIIGDNGEVLETHNNVLDENFNFSDMAGGNSSKQNQTEPLKYTLKTDNGSYKIEATDLPLPISRVASF